MGPPTGNGFGPFINGHQNSDPFGLNEFQFEGEMGPVADMSTFPPTMATVPSDDHNMSSMMSMDSILTSGFWDSVLVPGMLVNHQSRRSLYLLICLGVGYSNTMEGLSGGFVFGAGGSGLITPRFGATPLPSGSNTPSRGTNASELTQLSINAAFDGQSEGMPTKA